MSGKNSGLQLGTVTDLSHTVNYDTDDDGIGDFTVKYLIDATYSSQGGDSGAPVTLRKYPGRHTFWFWFLQHTLPNKATLLPTLAALHGASKSFF